VVDAGVEGNNLMNFKEFFNKEIKIEEAATIGDAMEGIFAIAVALYIADGYVDKNKLDAIRKQVTIKKGQPFKQIIDSTIAQDGWIAQQLPHIQPGNKLSVMVVISAKDTAKEVFGPSSKSIPNINNTINQMSDQIKHTSAIKKIEQFIVKVLTNHTPDTVVFYVVADGLKSGASKNEIKGDVMLRVEAKTKTAIPQDIEQPVSFSIKTDTERTSGLSIFTAILRVGNFFGLPFTKGLEALSTFPEVGGAGAGNIRKLIDGEFFQQAKDPNHLMFYVKKFLDAQDSFYFKTDPEEKELANQKVMEYAWNIVHKAIFELETQLKNKDEKYDITKRSFDFIGKEIFGADNADVIRLLPGSISEITSKDFQEIRNKYTVEVAIVGEDVKFIGVSKETGKRDLLFTLKPEIRMSGKQRVVRFDINLGPIFYKTVNQNSV
jgi:hypothetical protein